MPLCPSCQKVKLVRCKILRTDDADYGREYVACSACSSRWFLDDPERPLGLVSDKPKESIWKKIATWGAPHNVPDASGILHAATYVLPPVHEYPSLLVPISSPPVRRSLNLIPPARSSPDPAPASPAAGPSELGLDLPPPPPPPEPELDPLPPPEEVNIPDRASIEAADQLESPVEDGPPSSQKGDEPQQAEQFSEEPIPTPQAASPAPEKPASEFKPDDVASAAETSHQSESQIKLPPASNLDIEEQARFDVLSRIASTHGTPSRAPTCLPEEDHRQPSRPQSIRASEYEPSLNSKTPKSGPLSPEEQHLRETLLRIVSTPCPPTPKVYTTLLSPKVATQELITATSQANEQEVAEYAKSIASRLDQAIQNSPFIPKNTPKTPHTQRWLDSPRLSEHKSPASKHLTVHSQRHSTGQPRSSGQSGAQSVQGTPRTASRQTIQGTPRVTSRQSISQSVHGTPRSTKPPESVGTRSARQTPRQEYYAEEEVPLPGGFPTPKVTPLTTEAVGKLRSQGPTPYSTSLKSSATSAPLPIAPSHYTGSIVGGRNSKRVSIASIASSGKSPLWG
ncbi:hypothetical protein Pst134EB_007900 [Puccinia striiformis f. sp. tritici]|nr:hypothetical protein Pst134EB_007900 [Puccinia striiformis f. sp. tritici]